MWSTPFSVSSWKRASGPSTTVQPLPSQCSVRAPVPELRMEQQSDPTAHASVAELALTPFSMLSPLHAVGLGRTEIAALAVPGTVSLASTASRVTRVRSRDGIRFLPRKGIPTTTYTQRARSRFEHAGEAGAVRPARGVQHYTPRRACAGTRGSGLHAAGGGAGRRA